MKHLLLKRSQRQTNQKKAQNLLARPLTQELLPHLIQCFLSRWFSKDENSGLYKRTAKFIISVAT